MDEWVIVLEQITFIFRGKNMFKSPFQRDSTDSCLEPRTYQGLGHCSGGQVFPPTPAQGSLLTSTPHNHKMHNKKPQTTRQAVRM